MYIYLINIKNCKEAAICPTCRSVYFYEGPILLEVQSCGIIETRPQKNQPYNQLESNLETYFISRGLFILSLNIGNGLKN